MKGNVMEIQQFEMLPPEGHPIYRETVQTGSAFLAILMISKEVTTINSAVLSVSLFDAGQLVRTVDVPVEVEHDSLVADQPDALRAYIPNGLLVREGFETLDNGRLDFSLTVHHFGEDQKPLTFIHECSMTVISTRPIMPEINVRFETCLM